MSDISAIILTIGEETTKRAIDSVKKQTLLPKEIIIIENEAPFHEAMNLGVSKVKTEFFIQVDADMILDENCLEDLRRGMTEKVGIAMGQLRDPLMGLESGIKMFTKECFDETEFKNSISPDTDFYDDIEKNGWGIRHVLNLKYKGESKDLWPAFGDHMPHYTPVYTFRRYHLLGRRYRYRRDLYTFKRRFRNLQNSNHSVSIIAQVAMAHGLFLEDEIDLLMPSLYKRNEDFKFLEKFLRSENRYHINESNLLSIVTLKPEAIYRNFYKLGIDLRKSDSPSALKYCMQLMDIDRTCFSWIAKVGLCHGIFSGIYIDEKANKDYEIVKELL
jgi:glycosyltransferase involved in cell wall biosynthesis